MFWLYCLPGRLLTEIDFLFPRRGEVTASARRRDSLLLQFFLATIIYIGVGTAIVEKIRKAWLRPQADVSATVSDSSDRPMPLLSGSAPAPDASDALSVEQSASPDEEIGSRGDGEGGVMPAIPGGTGVLSGPAEAKSQAGNPAAAEQGAPFDPGTLPKVQEAIARAARTGETRRWKADGESGYAVPSTEAAADGCRTVRYTLDRRPADMFPAVTSCPE